MAMNRNVTGRQLAAARVLLGLGQVELAERANVSAATLRRMEASKGMLAGMKNNVAAVIDAVEAGGVVFVGDAERSQSRLGVTLMAEDQDFSFQGSG